MKMKGISVLMIMLLALVATTAVGAVPVAIDKVEVNDHEVDPTGPNSARAVDRNNEIDVDVELTGTAEVEDVQVEAVLRGYDSSDSIQDITNVFDMKANTTYVKGLTLQLPSELEKDRYKLRVRVENRDGDTTQETYELEIENKRHDLQIKDVIFSPYNEVTAGRSLLTTVRLENYGMNDEDSVKVSVRVPELGIEAADYLNDIDEEESVSSEELYMRINECTEAGTYDAIITAEYHNGEEIDSVTRSIDVVESEVCDDEDDEKADKPKTTIAMGPKTQDVKIGEGAVYPLTITNKGDSAKTYVVKADGYKDWADVRVSPANIVVLQPGEAKALYVYASPMQDAQEGEHMFGLSVNSDSETLKEFSLKANVEQKEEEEQSMDVKNVLLIGLLVLVVLLVILGLIIGFGKLRNDDKGFDEDTESGETYY